MSAFEEFETALGRAGAAAMSTWTEDDQDRLARRIKEVLLGDAVDVPGTAQRSSQKEFMPALIVGFGEIQESATCLRNVAVYVRRFPYANAGIEKGAYLRYHVENYLNELYILEKRLEAYIKVVSRLVSDERGAELAKLSKSVRRVFKESLSGADVARGVHVHQRRYTDIHLERLKVLELVKTSDSRLEYLYELAYKETRTTKRVWIERTNTVVEGLLDQYFEQLLPLLFDVGGQLIPPASSPR
ncbi:MAG: hypothetical protein FD171_670 [Actinobacteria bacterium]|nr:MAG: hypothetical protein FD171_670 [Actinomycetota bacterium]